MKKTVIVILMAAMLLVSCGGKSENEAIAPATDAPVSETETVTEETTAAEETTAEIEETTEIQTERINLTGEFDFSAVKIIGYKTVNIGEEFEIEWDGEDFVSSHPSVCTIEGKKATAIKKGVTLAGVTGTDTAYAVCVLPEGVFEDPMAGTPTMIEVGKTVFVEGFSSSEHTSSDPEVATLNGSRVEALTTGYVVIDMSNISMPKLFSYIVFDRETD